jgi:hypothetical protein
MLIVVGFVLGFIVGVFVGLAVGAPVATRLFKPARAPATPDLFRRSARQGPRSVPRAC